MIRHVAGIVIMGAMVIVAGSAFAQDPPARSPFPGGRMVMMPASAGRSLLDVVSRTDVQNELHLDLRQRNAINDLTQAKGGPVRLTARVDSSNPGESPEDQVKKQMEAQYGGIEGKLKELLKPEQFNRLLELDAQFRGPTALGDPRVAERAQLTAAHRREISELVNEYQRRRMQIIFEHSEVNTEGAGTDRVAMRVKAPDLNNPLSPVRKKLDPLKKEVEDKILGLLDAGEKERWNALQGAKFTFRADDPRGARTRY